MRKVQNKMGKSATEYHKDKWRSYKKHNILSEQKSDEKTKEVFNRKPFYMVEDKTKFE